MDDSSVTKKTFARWLEEATTLSKNAFESAHVDELEGLGSFDATGLDLVRQSCALLETGRKILHGVQGKRPFRYLLIFLPLEPTSQVSFWDDGLWGRISGADEPPTVYLFTGDQLLEEWDEEYRRPVQLPVSGYAALSALYRCWRTRNDMKNSWEFSRGVYIVDDFRAGHSFDN